MLKSNIP